MGEYPPDWLDDNGQLKPKWQDYLKSFPRYYTITRGFYFRLSWDGEYDTWDADTETWTNITDKGRRDYFSKSIEGGEAYPVRLADLASAGVTTSSDAKAATESPASICAALAPSSEPQERCMLLLNGGGAHVGPHRSAGYVWPQDLAGPQ